MGITTFEKQSKQSEDSKYPSLLQYLEQRNKEKNGNSTSVEDDLEIEIRFTHSLHQLVMLKVLVDGLKTESRATS